MANRIAPILRARERAAAGSPDATFYEQQLTRVQGVIEAQAAGLWQSSAPAEDDAGALPSGHSSHAGEVVRRKADTASDEAAAAEATPAEAPPVETAPVEAEVPETPSAPETAAAAEAAPEPTPSDVDALLGDGDAASV